VKRLTIICFVIFAFAFQAVPAAQACTTLTECRQVCLDACTLNCGGTCTGVGYKCVAGACQCESDCSAPRGDWGDACSGDEACLDGLCCNSAFGCGFCFPVAKNKAPQSEHLGFPASNAGLIAMLLSSPAGCSGS